MHFLAVELYSVHIFRRHNQDVDLSGSISIASSASSLTNDDGLHENVEHVTEQEISQNNADALELQCGKMFLALLAEHNITNSAIQAIILFFTEIGRNNKDAFEQKCKGLLELNSIPLSTLDGLFNEDILLNNLQLFKSDYFRKKKLSEILIGLVTVQFRWVEIMKAKTVNFTTYQSLRLCNVSCATQH